MKNIFTKEDIAKLFDVPERFIDSDGTYQRHESRVKAFIQENIESLKGSIASKEDIIGKSPIAFASESLKRPLPFNMRQETPMEKYRHDTFWTKEPETLAWIESFDPHDVFFDVGANVGIYSLYAASLFRDLFIMAFEPMLENIKAIHANKELNQFEHIYCSWSAVGNMEGGVSLEISQGVEAGYSGAQMRPPKVTDDPLWLIPCRRIDDMGERGPLYIKIDIDGQELEVVKGMMKTLPHIKSILIEVRPASKGPIVDILTAAGFTMDNRFNTMSPHSRERRAAEGISDENIVFTR